MDLDTGRRVTSAEPRLDEVHLRLDCGQVVLGPPLEHEVAPEAREVGHLGHVEPDVLGQHGGQAGHDLLGPPALALEVDDVGLHEDRAPVAEARHAAGGERRRRVLAHGQAEHLGGRLEEVPVAGRALGVEPEVRDLSVVEQDDLDVLAADVADDIDVAVGMQGRAGVGHRLDQCDVSPQRFAQDVLGVAGRGLPSTRSVAPWPVRRPRAGTAPPGVLDGVAPRQLVGLRQHPRSGESRTALVEVEPPSSPRNASTVSPGGTSPDGTAGAVPGQEARKLVLARRQSPARGPCQALDPGSRRRSRARARGPGTPQHRTVRPGPARRRRARRSRAACSGTRTSSSSGPTTSTPRSSHRPGQVVLPGLDQAGQERVGSAEQQDSGARACCPG